MKTRTLTFGLVAIIAIEQASAQFYYDNWTATQISITSNLSSNADNSVWTRSYDWQLQNVGAPVPHIFTQVDAAAVQVDGVTYELSWDNGRQAFYGALSDGTIVKAVTDFSATPGIPGSIRLGDIRVNSDGSGSMADNLNNITLFGLPITYSLDEVLPGVQSDPLATNDIVDLPLSIDFSFYDPNTLAPVSENGTVDARGLLENEALVPEPGTMAVLGVCALAISRRRRKSR